MAPVVREELSLYKKQLRSRVIHEEKGRGDSSDVGAAGYDEREM